MIVLKSCSIFLLKNSYFGISSYSDDKPMEYHILEALNNISMLTKSYKQVKALRFVLETLDTIIRSAIAQKLASRHLNHHQAHYRISLLVLLIVTAKLSFDIKQLSFHRQ